MTQTSLFGPSENGPAPKPTSDAAVRLRLVVTVKAAPNPSERYGETVCVAGISADMSRPGWIRLYPINYRGLASDERFRKYDIVTVQAKPARQDQRRESWRPMIETLIRDTRLQGWGSRRPWIEPYLEDSMCQLNKHAQADPNAKSLGLVRARDISALHIEPHPGWTPEEQRKIDSYVGQLDLFGNHDRTPLQAPRYRAAYRYRCHDPRCAGHRQGPLDWEFVAFQRRLTHAPDQEARRAIENKFLHQICAPNRDVAFYVGNQAKRPHVFSVLGVWWPPRH